MALHIRIERLDGSRAKIAYWHQKHHHHTLNVCVCVYGGGGGGGGVCMNWKEVEKEKNDVFIHISYKEVQLIDI